MSSNHDRKTDIDQLVVDLVDDLVRRMREDELVDLDAFVADHAQYADQLRALFPALELLADMSVFLEHLEKFDDV